MFHLLKLFPEASLGARMLNPNSDSGTHNQSNLSQYKLGSVIVSMPFLVMQEKENKKE